MIRQITAAYVRYYRDSGQTTAYVEWIDGNRDAGRTEGACRSRTNPEPRSGHMAALFERARRDGLTIERQVW